MKYKLLLIIYNICVMLLFANNGSAMNIPEYAETYLDSMAIHIEPGANRPYVYSGNGRFFYGTTGDVANGHMGFYIGENKLWDDFELVIDGTDLKRSEASVEFLPYKMVFTWQNGVSLEILPLFNMWNNLGFRVTGVDKSSKAALKLKFVDEFVMNIEEIQLPQILQKFSDNLIIKSEVCISEGGVVGKADGKVRMDFPECNFEVIFIDDVNKQKFQDFEPLFRKLSFNLENGVKQRKKWCLESINSAYFRCNDETINKALNWMKISLSSLGFDDGGKLWAGLPWFNDCWGRDTFISLAGTGYAGNCVSWKKVISTFAKWQCMDSTSSNYGRIPNRVRAGEIVYNTADGTPRFIKAIYDYGVFSGDYAFWKQLAEDGVIQRALEGTLMYHCDSLGFLTHGDAETWMDAVGTEGAWSPRGNRAVDIQALWYEQLEATIAILGKLCEERVYNNNVMYLKKANLHKELLQKNFLKYFLKPDSSGLYDHLNEDGTPDLQVRPNELFALKMVPTEIKNRILESAKQEYIYPYGVASLAQTDENFHPYHQYFQYPKDAAYHNGVVWTWLSGIYKSESKAGWTIARQEMDIALNHGAPGTLSELLDAVPLPGQILPANSGTVSQAWSLAEFLRSFYQDYLGWKPLAPKERDIHWAVSPRIPPDIANYAVCVNIYTPGKTINNNYKVISSYKIDNNNVIFTFRLTYTPFQPIYIDLFGPGGQQIVLADTTEKVLKLEHSGSYLTHYDAQGKKCTYQFLQNIEQASEYLQPYIDKNLRALRPPNYRVLSGAEIKQFNPMSHNVCNIEDPKFDDDGRAKYTYPTDSNFREGILDITKFLVSCDAKNAYFRLEFRELVQPGWHPEYGFQLTYALIALRTAQNAPGNDNCQGNSGWRLKNGYEANRFIYIGGGLRIEDEKHKILAEHIPWGSGYELGDVSTKAISFSIPRDLLPGNPEEWKMTVLVGAQDDHGGAGIGEFRNVEEKVGRWVGGGKKAGGSNVYDWLLWP